MTQEPSELAKGNDRTLILWLVGFLISDGVGQPLNDGKYPRLFSDWFTC